MGEYRVANKTEAYEVIRAAIERVGRDDTPYTYGAAPDHDTGEQIIYFDLPRVSPLQFNVSVKGIAGREELVERIERAILERLADDV
jgi:hypothetical protein